MSGPRPSSPTRQLPLDLDHLLKLRLVVARHGEMDAARWWNTQGVLGRRGSIVLKRGFPTTYAFAQARIVFEVARSRCRELFDPPGCIVKAWEWAVATRATDCACCPSKLAR